MTPRMETNLERSVGRIEGQLEALAVAIAKLTEKADQADEWRHEVRERLEKIEARDVSSAFLALQQSIREGGLQMRAGVKGVMVGVALAGGAAGATVATLIKGLWAWAMG